ncbi:uncharacterized protein BXZ73DRAFT_87292 [Epithele typhae]|uniref:uncharacterized protein n=1 Tax=Epithele typhae TaxID=378194 RepID=UPI0020083B26|nr:uncharacterized protein BXZ73DRAFT_87292 [Epithele typhae]KAH9944384.1 hypothetical protein BXZ73DRAFT_87292 [Epithele typhae]
MSSPSATLQVRINHIDYTVIPPGLLDNSTLHRVPVIRIYGDSSLGHNTCLHVHQVYPYFLVEYLGKMNPDLVQRYVSKLKHSLNHAIAISLKRNPESVKSQFVRAIVLVKGVHFYGFHSNYAPFLKVHIADPAFVSRAVTIMQSGTVMSTRFRVYESHLSYILQFLSDFGLYGCGWINLGEVWRRGREEEDEKEEHTTPRVDFKDSPYHRQSRMPLEVDVAAHQILNRHKLSAREIHHKLTVPAPPLPPEPLVLSVRELWEDERQRRAAKGLEPSPELPKDPSANSREPGGDWVAEARWWEEIRMRIEKERGREAPPLKMSWERWVMTTFESVEALWEDEYKTWKPQRKQANGNGEHEDDNSGTSDANPYHASQGSGTASGFLGALDGAIAEEVDPAMAQFMEHEETEWPKDGNDGEEGEDEQYPEEDEMEDGPPPDKTLSQNDTEKRESPTELTPSPTNDNPFANVWSKVSRCARSSQVSRSSSVQRSQSLTSVDPKTPTKLTPASPAPLTPSPSRPATKRPFARAMSSDSVLPGPPVEADTSRAVLQPLQAIEDNVLVEVDTAMTTAAHGDKRPAKKRKLSPPLPPVAAPARSTESNTSDPVSDVSFQSFTPIPTSQLLSDKNVFQFARSPPTTAELLGSTDRYNIPSKVYRDPWYSKESDAPDKPREFAGLVFHLKGGEGVANLEEWQATLGSESKSSLSHTLSHRGVSGWEFAGAPPSVRQVRKWLQEDKVRASQRTAKDTSQASISGPTQLNPFGLKNTLVARSDKVKREKQTMTILGLEVFAPSRDDRVPDPAEDEIVAVFYSFQDSVRDSDGAIALESGIIAVESEQLSQRRLRAIKADYAENELELLNKFIDMANELDPDVLTGWEIQAGSWGYLSARGRIYGLDLEEQLSRAPARHVGGRNDRWGMRTTSTFKVIGRHALNTWRIMRSEQNLNIYTFENVVFHVLRQRTPWYSPRKLTEWHCSAVPMHAEYAIRYFSRRAAMVVEMLDAVDVVTKTAEFARVFGVDFFSVLSRGSQFKVESFMFRIAKPESFVLLSPSKQDVGKQNAAECIPLIMEPLSAFYSSPLVVLDFQSLYPSVMIAYNYCYSTCLGRVTEFKGTYKFGVTDLRQPAGILDTLKDHINVAPNGMMYVKETVRKGLLARMLIELLDTRVMVKQAMKGANDDKALRRILDARQLGLKYIANVTYGYTSASYSGRMPAVEIADSIVQSGRETLEKAIRVINGTSKWGAKVVYGDTDSLFIYLRGKTKDQAFRIGQDMADTITRMNPAPIKLKFEKVYLPCVLMAKKRYVGFKFENPDDTEPVFDAKGIETVRRDGVPAQQKMTETCLKILFRTQDLSAVKEYCCRTWNRILDNKASPQDFIFAKEVRMGTYSDKVPPPPGVTVAARRMLEDPNDEPQYGERIPYVIARGEPGSRLVDRAIDPHELFRDNHKRLDATYYISRVLIPPLERIFNLVGADVRSWYDEMPKSLRADQPDVTLSPRKSKSKEAIAANAHKIDDHFLSSRCLICGGFTPEVLCDLCRTDYPLSMSELLARIHKTERRLMDVHLVCSSCSGIAPGEPVDCETLDCPWFYERQKTYAKSDALATIHELVDDLEEESKEEPGCYVHIRSLRPVTYNFKFGFN